MNDQPDHPALVRLRAELDAARQGIGVLGELEDVRRDRVVAELRTAVPDAASRAAHTAGRDAVVAEVRRHAGTAVTADPRAVADPASLWHEITDAAVEAADAVAATEPHRERTAEHHEQVPAPHAHATTV